MSAEPMMRAVEVTAWENGVVIHYGGPDDGTYDEIMALLEDRYGHYEKVSAGEARDIRDAARRRQRALRVAS